MGYYIQTPGHSIGKAEVLTKEHGAIGIPRPEFFNDIPSDMGLLCIVNNFAFEAVAYCYDEREFQAFTDPKDTRPKIWLIMEKTKAEEMSGFKR